MALQLNSVSDSARRAFSAGADLLDRQSMPTIAGTLLLGLVLSGVVALTATQIGVEFVIPLALAVPVGLLLARYPFAAVILWLLIFPFVARGTAGLAVPAFWAVHRFMIPGALWIVLLSSWTGERKRAAVRFGPAEAAMGLSLLWTLGNIILLGQEPTRLVLHFYDRVFVPYSMYWLVRLIAPTAEDLRRLLPVAFFTVVTQAIIGILSWFVPTILPPQWLGEAGERVVGTFRNPAVFTSTVLFLSLLIFQYGMHSKSTRVRALSVFTLGLSFLCVAISFSRGSWIGGLLVLLGLTIVYPGVTIRLTTISLSLGLILGSTVLSQEIAFGYQRLTTEETAQGRLLTGAKSLGMVERKPLFGWGYGNYDHYDENFRVQIGNIVNENEKTSHNTYLTVMAEQGIPALVFYLFPAGWWFLQSLAVWRRLPRRGFWSVSLLALLWLLMLDHFTVSNFMDMIRFNYFGTTIWWMALGLIAAIVASYEPAARPEPARVEKSLASRARRVEPELSRRHRGAD